MKRLTIIGVIMACVVAMAFPVWGGSIFGWSSPPVQHNGRWHLLAAGVDYRDFTLSSPTGTLSGAEVRIDLANRKVALHAVTPRSEEGFVAPVASMLRSTHHGVVAINTSFFRIWRGWAGKATPLDGLVVNGVVYQSQWTPGSVDSGYSELMVEGSSKVSIGYWNWSGTVSFAQNVRKLVGVNITETDTAPRQAYGDPWTRGLMLLTASCGYYSFPGSGSGSTLAILHRQKGKWIVREVHTFHTTPPFQIPMPGVPRPGWAYVVARTAGAKRWLNRYAHVGQPAVITQYTEGVSQVVAGGPLMVSDHHITDTIGDREPPEAKSGAMLNRAGTVLTLIAISGNSRTIGLTRHEFAGWLRWQGAWSAIMFDDGGSTQLAARSHGIRDLNSLADEGYLQRHIAEALAVTG